ncbi:hypothetical protein TNCV_3214051 [Trichonephila clavipes]|nr:hypothetical protein TNCV_3214051 [Trichonephila clavipes]
MAKNAVTCSRQIRGDPCILPDRLTGPYDILGTSFARVIAHVTASTSMWFQQDGAPAHFSISVRNHLKNVENDRFVVLRQTIPVWIISSGGNEILGVRNTRKQRRGTCSTHQCSSRGNTKHPEMLSNRMKRRCEAITCGGRQFEHLL